ncbi:hypothetical protein HH303_14515 [Rhodospirillaceae bacterium KN72]|uniref:Transglutaminase-like domain-containing protein n=1 Tax=Pacificispira spongiicola TaxID=2729598 RepID=A0A7Y0E1V3_9PROT|nr:hypothetical protein [Pacificispira spongiicola]NMM45707.1 hypothetical protein [Pacificispira spongiicola]
MADKRSDIRPAVDLFHEVRRYRYLSDGVRDPLTIADRRAGSCTGKHLLLRDRLRQAGFKADVETVRGDFAAGIPVHPGMSAELREMVQEAGVDDFHNYVVLRMEDGRTLRLDATWNDALRPFGFPVNDRWHGEGDTAIALEPQASLGVREDVVAFKKDCLDQLPRANLARRARFLELLSEWISEVDEMTTG